MKIDMYGIFEIVNSKKPELRVAFSTKTLAEQYAKSITSLKHNVDSNASIKTIIKPIEAVCNEKIEAGEDNEQQMDRQQQV